MVGKDSSKKGSRGSRKKIRRVVYDGVARIYASFNNTIVTIADQKGNLLAWSTAGSNGFKGSRKGTPYAAGIAARKAAENVQEYGMKNLEIEISGPGPGRESAARALYAAGFSISQIRDVTPLPHNGCRAPKRRRV